MRIRVVYVVFSWLIRQESHVARAWTHHSLASQHHGRSARRGPPGASRAPPRGLLAPRILDERITVCAECTRGGKSWAFANASTEALELEAQPQHLNGDAAANDVRVGRAPTEEAPSPFLLQRRRITHSPDQVAKTTLGDIMSMGLITGAGPSSLSSSSSRGGAVSDHPPAQEETLADRYGICHPLDRMALTANGNLQRLICSYYDSPVSVTLDRQYRQYRQQQQQQPPEPERESYRSEDTWNGNSARESPPAAAAAAASSPSPSPSSHVWHRVVHLTVFEQTFCTATSVIAVHDPTCQLLVESGQVGLGQLFRYLDLLPEFTLLGAGPNEGPGPTTPERRPSAREADRPSAAAREGGGNFWREYRLDCNELSCRIREEFCPGLWDLRPWP